jgi:hypothetical protein
MYLFPGIARAARRRREGGQPPRACRAPPRGISGQDEGRVHVRVTGIADGGWSVCEALIRGDRHLRIRWVIAGLIGGLMRK